MCWHLWLKRSSNYAIECCKCAGSCPLRLGSSQLAQRFAQDSKERKELRRLEDEWLSSYLRADKTIFDRIVAEDFTGTDESAKVRNKAQARELIQVPPSSIKASLTNEDVQFRIYGDTAVVTGRIESAGLLSKTWMVSALNARRVMPSV